MDRHDHQPPRRRTREQRELWRLIIAAMRDTDRILTSVADDIVAIIRRYGVIDATTRPAIMREIDRVLDAAFGLTQRAALTSLLYRTILTHTDRAAAAPFAAAIRDIRDGLTRRDPRLWERVRLRLLQGGKGPDDVLARVYGVLDGPGAQRQRILRAGKLDPQRRWVPRERWNTRTGYRLSDRGWYGGRQIRRDIDDRLRQGMLRGEDPLRVARDLEQYLRPEAAPTQYTQDGRIVRRNMTAAPRSGWGSTWARRLVRTEVSRLHGAATIEAAKAMPVETNIRWNVSNRHSHIDNCTENAMLDPFDLGAGVYPPDEVPDFPGHPSCVCTLSPVVGSREDVLDAIVAQYGGL